MGALRYRKILEDHLLPKAVEIGGQEWTFQQDSAGIHTAWALLEWFSDIGINQMKWPAISQDLNPIEKF
jgi:hypothetical protein